MRGAAIESIRRWFASTKEVTWVSSPRFLPHVLNDSSPVRSVQLTDALNALSQMPAEDGGTVHGVVFTGRRYYTGDRGDYLRTIVKLAA